LFVKLLGKSQIIKEIRASGLMIAIQLDSFKQVKKAIDYCIQEGVITDWFLFNDSSIRIAPPLTISEEQIVEACTVILDALQT